MNFILDVDECLVNNGECSQACINTPGSWTCTCTPGYQLGLDGHSCYRKLTLAIKFVIQCLGKIL